MSLCISAMSNHARSGRSRTSGTRAFSIGDPIADAAMVSAGNLHTTDLAFFRKMLEVNTLAPFALIKAALPHLKKDGGALITVGSEVSDSFAPLMSMYVASKHAIKGYIGVCSWYLGGKFSLLW